LQFAGFLSDAKKNSARRRRPADSLQTPMQDIVLNRSLRLTIVGTISALCLTCLVLCYQALFDAICGNFADSAGKFIWGLAAGTAGLALIRHRSDLIDT
jgi:hypothetical protein